VGVKALYHAIRDRVEVLWPLSEMDYGTVAFGIRDLDGYTLAFAEQAGSEGTVGAAQQGDAADKGR